MEKQGYVYILTNPSFKEDWVKIGKSAVSVEQRVKQLDGTAVPLPFEIYATLKTKMYSEVEKAVHQTIDSLTDLRIRQNREFFNITPQEALNILKRFATMLEDAEITEYQKPKESTCYTQSATDKQKPRHEKRKAFWKEFIQYCKDNDGLFANNSPVGDNWIGKGIGAPFGINMCAVIGYDFARIEIYFNSGEKELNKKVFDYLYSKKDEIEAEYGGSLIWERHTDKVTCKVSDAIQFSCFDVEDRTEVFKFLKEASEKMSPIFHNYTIDFKNSL
jgi:hypothetical protein